VSSAKIEVIHWRVQLGIQNHIHVAKKACQLSNFDQENLHLKIKEWRKTIVHFRPYNEGDENGDNKQSLHQQK